MKPGTPPLQSTRLLNQLRERIRYMHYTGIRTVQELLDHSDVSITTIYTLLKVAAGGTPSPLDALCSLMC